ncbi:hypothetical protein ACH5RR_027492 [Cinchona calisaya]|uniref:Uncharacterized protein n=1 Tax=Cinchona calisaya TaxID=153742 RepID=A0ABD2Z5P0_9GENT
MRYSSLVTAEVELRGDCKLAKVLDRSASLQVNLSASVLSVPPRCLSASVLSVPPRCLFLATPLQVGMGATNTACTISQLLFFLSLLGASSWLLHSKSGWVPQTQLVHSLYWLKSGWVPQTQLVLAKHLLSKPLSDSKDKCVN